ncbi:MAG: 2-amino-4-hydroxy-6-hydroxymethyldihydropteridine diphosphokinase [Bacteroidota bacterium]|nr:2-amino-4-hydroxy-6-hydroxymethyldihydropteridine diphosphokinase [Bacteroidota bacterium]
MKPYTAYILIGGNIGDRFANLATAKELITNQCGTVINESSVYQTAAWGLTEQPDFLNQVLMITTKLLPEQLMQNLLSIEESMGRKRSVKFGPRIIDLDILLIDDLVIDTELLSVPHPALPQRKFALIPLSEVAPDLLHPVEKKAISQLLTACNDELVVQKISASAS